MKHIKTYEQKNFDVNDYIDGNTIELNGINPNVLKNLELPNTLEMIYCYDQNITKLPDIPLTSKNLIKLSCWNNKLTKLPELPDSITEIYCEENNLTELPELPKQLKHLFCDNNDLTELPELPKGLITLSCSNNNLTKLPKLPNSLKLLNCGDNNLPYNNLKEYWKWFSKEHPDLWAAKQMGLY